MAEPQDALRSTSPRSVVVTVMAVLFFWGIGRVPLAQAIALTFIAPLIAMLLAPLFLKEQLGRRSIARRRRRLRRRDRHRVSVRRGRRSGRDVLLGIAAILASALCYSGNIVMMRRQALAAKPLEINFFQSLDGAAAVDRRAAADRPAALARAARRLDRRRLGPFDQRQPALRLGLCARRGELPRRHRI